MFLSKRLGSLQGKRIKFVVFVHSTCDGLFPGGLKKRHFKAKSTFCVQICTEAVDLIFQTIPNDLLERGKKK